jgi:hypothetical protein
MKLYHFTFIEHFPAIHGAKVIDDTTEDNRVEILQAQGITPSLGAEPTAGEPAVWLTARDSLMPTPDDLAWMSGKKASGRFTKDEAEDYAKVGPLGDRTLRLTVELSNSKRLRHYGTWLRANGMDRHVALAPPSSLTDWWVYFGTVQRQRIVSFARTDAPFVDDDERDVWRAIEMAYGPQ